MADTEEELRQVRIRLIEMEQKARDTENMLMQAAQYGKDLLEKNIELESNNENLQQEKYEINLKLQVIISNTQLHLPHIQLVLTSIEGCGLRKQICIPSDTGFYLKVYRFASAPFMLSPN